MGQLMPSFVHVQPTEKITFERLADLIADASYTVALTGAGVSAESGVPTYRDPNSGLWQKYDMMECASAWGYWRRPHKLWELIRDVAETNPQPNAAHEALQQLEAMGYLRAIVTQNVDGLHQEAGSKEVIEFHGSLMQCRRCKVGRLKPDATLFGESCPPAAVAAAQRHVDAADLVLVIGTGASVRPASDLPYRARSRKALVVEVNPRSTELTDRVSHMRVIGKASGLMKTVDLLKSRKEKKQQQPRRERETEEEKEGQREESGTCVNASRNY